MTVKKAIEEIEKLKSTKKSINEKRPTLCFSDTEITITYSELLVLLTCLEESIAKLENSPILH